MDEPIVSERYPLGSHISAAHPTTRHMTERLLSVPSTSGTTSVRVLHVVSTGERRGAEIFASDLVGSLGKMGVEQHVAVVRAFTHDNLPYEAGSTLLGTDGPIVRALRLDPVRVLRLRRLIAGHRPDVLQAHGGESLWYSVAAASGQHDPPIVYRKIGRINPSAARGLRRTLYRLLARRAARVVIVAEALRREAETILGVPPYRIVRIANGIDPGRLIPTHARASVRRDLGVPLEAPVILSLAALTWEKDPIAHLRVARSVLRRFANAFYVLAGDGPMRREVEEAIRADGFADRILFLGSRPDVADLVSASDVLLLASRMEGMPACIIEAGMVGIPVAAYDFAGIPEVIEHGVTGSLAPYGDEERLGALIMDLLEDPAQGRSMGLAARSRCLSAFDIQAVASTYLALYQGMKGQP